MEKKDIEELLCFYLGLSYEGLFRTDEIADELLPKIEEGFKRVMQTEPVQYVTQVSHFYGRDFYVDSRVLVPRVDTEVLVDKVLEHIWKLGEKCIVSDVGTGSGCIGQSIFLSDRSGNIEQLYGFDISKEAVEVAQINAQRLGVQNITLIPEGFDNFEKHFEEKIFSDRVQHYVITANLPYIRTIDFWGMEKSVFFHEPSVALFWGKATGFELYERFIGILKNIKLKYPAISLVLFMEFWYDQYELSKVFLSGLWVDYEHFKDTKGIWRVIQIHF